MAETTPGATPATPAATPPAQPAAPNAGNPPTTPTTPADGVKIEGDKVVLDLAKYRNLERDAARGRSKKAPNAEERRDQRYNSQPTGSGDDDDQEKVQLRQKVTEAETKAMKLELNNKVRDLLESDEYKTLPETAKRILKKNPIALVDPRAKTVDDAIADIQDWMDEELGNVTPAQPGNGGQGQPPAAPATPETPPVNGSQPNPSASSGEESIEGKTGPARSQAVLKNLFKKSGIRKG